MAEERAILEEHRCETLAMARGLPRGDIPNHMNEHEEPQPIQKVIESFGRALFPQVPDGLTSKGPAQLPGARGFLLRRLLWARRAKLKPPDHSKD